MLNALLPKKSGVMLKFNPGVLVYDKEDCEFGIIVSIVDSGEMAYIFWNDHGTCVINNDPDLLISTGRYDIYFD